MGPVISLNYRGLADRVALQVGELHEGNRWPVFSLILLSPAIRELLSSSSMPLEFSAADVHITG